MLEIVNLEMYNISSRRHTSLVLSQGSIGVSGKECMPMIRITITFYRLRIVLYMNKPLP